MGLVAFFTLTAHGANFIALKTEGEVQARARSISAKAWWGVTIASIAALVATSEIRPEIWTNYSEHLWGFIFPLIGLLGLIGMMLYNKRGQDRSAFISSTAFIGGMLASTAFGLYPNLLPASTDPSYSLTIQNSAASAYGLTVGLVWWIIGIILAAGYFIYIYRAFRGKVVLPAEGAGY
jgi:cytochrome d ubiquinol oxidase subunit II